jgi:hypothetical protein
MRSEACYLKLSIRLIESYTDQPKKRKVQEDKNCQNQHEIAYIITNTVDVKMLIGLYYENSMPIINATTQMGQFLERLSQENTV